MKKTLALVVLVLLLSCCGCLGQKEYTFYYYDRFDTFSYLTVYAKSEEEASRYEHNTEHLIAYFDRLLNSFEPEEDLVNLYTLNETAGQGPVEVDEELFLFLRYALDAYQISHGSVNIGLGRVTALWREQQNSENPQLPSEEALKEAARFCDLSKVVLDEEAKTVSLPEGMLLDAGALAKGYVAGIIQNMLQTAGCRRALLSLGGNVTCIGSVPGKNGWAIGVRNPQLESSQALLTTVTVKDASLVTSGDYERFFAVDGVLYHHIIDPETLFPAARYHSVTILCDDPAMSDLLSTALFILPEEEGRQLADLYQAKVLYVYPDYSVSDLS